FRSLGGCCTGRGVDDDRVSGDGGIDDGLLITVDVDDEELLLRFPVRQRGDRFLECGRNDVLVLGIGGFGLGCGLGCGVGGSGSVGGDRCWRLLVGLGRRLSPLASFGRRFGLHIIGRCLGLRVGLGRRFGLRIGGLCIGGPIIGSLGRSRVIGISFGLGRVAGC